MEHCSSLYAHGERTRSCEARVFYAHPLPASAWTSILRLLLSLQCEIRERHWFRRRHTLSSDTLSECNFRLSLMKEKHTATNLNILHQPRSWCFVFSQSGFEVLLFFTMTLYFFVTCFFCRVLICRVLAKTNTLKNQVCFSSVRYSFRSTQAAERSFFGV